LSISVKKQVLGTVGNYLEANFIHKKDEALSLQSGGVDIRYIEERDKTVSDYSSKRSFLTINGQRIPQKADQKHSESGQKRRKVEHS